MKKQDINYDFMILMIFLIKIFTPIGSARNEVITGNVGQRKMRQTYI